MPNSKLFGLFLFFSRLACERFFIKTHSVESRCDIEPKIHCLQGCPCTFSLETLQAGEARGLKQSSQWQAKLSIYISLIDNWQSTFRPNFNLCAVFGLWDGRCVNVRTGTRRTLEPYKAQWTTSCRKDVTWLLTWKLTTSGPRPLSHEDVMWLRRDTWLQSLATSCHEGGTWLYV